MKQILDSIKSFLNKFPYRIISEKEKNQFNLDKAQVGAVFAEALGYSNERAKLLKEIERLGRELEYRGYEKKFIPVDFQDPSPLDTEQRRNYVAQVAGLFKDVLEPKLTQMISAFHNLLEEGTNQRDDDQAIKGAVYMCREFIRWGNLMISEHLAFVNNEHPSSEEEKL